MSTELDHLRAFRAADAAPGDAARAAARAALLERIDDACAPAPARRPTARRPRLLAGAFGLAAAAAVAAALVLTLGSGGVVAPEAATAAQVLRSAAVVAEQQPDVTLRPGQYWYVRTESRQTSADGGEWVREDWASFDGPTRSVRRPLAGGPVEQHTFDGERTYGFFPQPLTHEQMLALPLATDALYAVIERGGALWASQNGRVPADRTHEMFTIVGDWLRAAPALPSDLRAALYRVAARLPDVELLGEVRDAHGRTGVAVAQTDGHLRRELVVDPDTSQLLVERTVEAGSGALVYEATYVETGVVDSSTARP